MKLCFLCVFLLQSRTAYVKSHTYLLVPLPVDQSVFETFFFLLVSDMSFFVICDIKVSPVKEIFPKARWSEFKVVKFS